MKISIPECLPGCAHDWDIESAQGEFSHATCKVCKQEADFINAVPFIPTGAFTAVDEEMREAKRKFYQELRYAVWDNDSLKVWQQR